MKALRFLLLENNPLDATRIEEKLIESGINCNLLRVETASSYVAALKTDRFDLILADYELPDLDGMTALKLACHHCPRVPFIFVAAPLGEEVAIEMLQQGATDYVLKQRLERLPPAIQRALQIQEQTSQPTGEPLQELEQLATAAKYQTLFDSIDEGFCICEIRFDQNGEPQDYRFLEVNSAFEQITGLQQAAGKTARELIPNLKDHWIEVCSRVVQTGKPIQYENQSIDKNYWFHISAFYINDLQDNKFAVLVNNITDRKQTEKSLRQAYAGLVRRHQQLEIVNQNLERTLQELYTHQEELRTQNEELVTARQINEAERQRYQDLFNFAPDGYVVTDANGMVQEANQAITALLHFDVKAQMLPTPLSVYVTETDQRAFRNFLLKLYQHPQAQTCELNLKPRRGTPFPAGITAVAIRDDQEKILNIRWLIRDITDRKQVEAALRKSEEKYRTLFESIDEGFCIVEVLFDEDTKPINYRFLNVNPAFEKQTGHKDVVGKTVQEIVTQHEDYWNERYGGVALTGEPIRVEDHSEGFNGWYEVHAFRVGEPELRQVGILFTNITERKRAEEELRQKNAILNVINESTPTPIFVKDRQGRIIYANPATLEVLGKSAVEVIGFRDCDLYPNLEDAARVMENDQRIMATGQMEVVEESPDGIRTFLGMKVPYRNEQGDIIGLIGISNDISERIQIERDRERVLQQEQVARQAAEQANRIKDEFLAVLSHELRSPLNPILGWAKLLQTGRLDEEKTRQAITTIERNAKLQAELIEDLLDVSRILRGKLSLTVSPVNLASTIQAAIETVRLAAEAKSIQIETRLDPINGKISGDPTRLQQVIWNLLSNAVKFTPAGGRVEVQLEQIINDCSPYIAEAAAPSSHSPFPIPHHAQITVSDTGKGISPEFLPHVFDYFRQADSATTRQFGGLGLGLAIVRHLVELHGGTIEVDSPGEGLGATFTVRLPLLESRSSDVEPGAYNTGLCSSHAPLTGTQILVVDDEIDSRDLIEFVLKQAGATVITATSAAEALSALSRSQPDVLLSDVGMPNTDGYALIRQIRTLSPDRGGRMPAIALTAYAGDFDQQMALQAGFQQHISKPVEPEALIKAIIDLMGSVSIYG